VKLRNSPSLMRLALLSMSIIFAVVMTLVADRFAAFFMDGEHDLVFPRRSVVNYSTPEFQIEARINNLGFRGQDCELRKRKRYRVMTLGDSFTFGWGVEIRDTWPKVLEEELQRRGLDAEVVNLGQPGAYPARYSEIAQRAIPVLRPDLVIVAINHGDDLAQTLEISDRQESLRTVWNTVKSGIKSMYPNLMELRRRASTTREAMGATDSWTEQVADLLPRLSAEERAKFDRMDGEIKEMFVRGELNPGMLSSGLRHPDEIKRTLDLESPLVQKGIQQISKHLSRIKDSAEEAGGRLVVISLPNGFFVSELMLESYARMGFLVDQSYLTTTAMDDAVRMAASQAGVDFLEVTQVFRRESMTRNLFYRFDGHYNSEGQRFFAESISPFVRAKLREVDRHGDASPHGG
jgi:lysophospholipase L1-like esterase